VGGFFFFFQAEDGIRDKLVTGVQTCALPICVEHAALRRGRERAAGEGGKAVEGVQIARSFGMVKFAEGAIDQVVRVEAVGVAVEIGRASCRERGWRWGVGRGVEEEQVVTEEG